MTACYALLSIFRVSSLPTFLCLLPGFDCLAMEAGIRFDT